MVLCFPKGQSNLLGQKPDNPACEFRMRIDPISNGRPSQGQFLQIGPASLDSIDSMVNLHGIPGKFLPHPDRNRILEVGASDFRDFGELSRLTRLGVMEAFQSRKKVIPQQ